MPRKCIPYMEQGNYCWDDEPTQEEIEAEQKYIEERNLAKWHGLPKKKSKAAGTYERDLAEEQKANAIQNEGEEEGDPGHSEEQL